ncbi:MAG TPA: 3,4-dehydroadipyl-CoA semialdehyde dehydrogenase [Rhabdaerophilum sp.]|nr:3,4-dehydroadipyl-CoA semialdehyde dehydrogenase [Rhabdaerophilum sp.]
MKLESYVSGRWQAGKGEGLPLFNPVTGAVIARADASGLDVAAALAYARNRGRATLAAMSFAERGTLLKAIADVLTANREAYEVIARENSGNTRVDAAIDIDGGIGTLRYYAKLGQGLGAATLIVEAGQDPLARDPVFFARHFWRTRPGVAVQINAFNFPSWGLWEKVAVAMLAGVPSFIKPATASALLSWRMVKDVIASGKVPEGALSLLCGSGEGLLYPLGPMDSVAFTGSAATGETLRAHPNAIRAGFRLTIEADSVNATILGPDARPGTVVFDLAVREATKALSIKAGQLCTNIRRILVPRALSRDFAAALGAQVEGLTVGDPADEAVRVGPVMNAAQQKDAQEKKAALEGEARVVAQAKAPEAGAFVAPTLLLCDAPVEAQAIHDVEVFGPCASILPYENIGEAVSLGMRGGGSLALSLFTNDREFAGAALDGLGPWHGRVLVVDEEVGRNHTGHAIVMPQCVHGGPGRSGGGEELGGLRGLRFHMQRSAVQAGLGLLARDATRAVEASL